MTTVKTLMTATAVAAVLAGAASDVQARCTWCGIAGGIGAGLLLGGMLAAPRYAPQPYYAPQQYYPPQQPRYVPPQTSNRPATSIALTNIALTCDAGHTDIGDAGANDIASAHVVYESGRWTVRYTFINGTTIDRST